MARYFSGGTKNYTLRRGVYEEDGDKIGNGLGTATTWLNDGERNSTFELGDAVNSVAVFIGSISVDLASGGSVDLPVFQNSAQPRLIWISANKTPTDPDFLFPDVLDIDALDTSPLKVLKGPTRFDDDFNGINSGESVYLLGGDDVFRARDGRDFVHGGKGGDTIYGQAGDDFLGGDGGRDKLFGGGGKDTLRGEAGDDVVDGGKGSDTLFGDGGNDVLRGDKGNDDLTGGTGHDRLWGGAGADHFNFSTSNGKVKLGRDKILDYNPKLDTLFLFVSDVEAVSVKSFRKKTVIDHEGGKIILDGIGLTDNQIDDLIIL